MATAPQIAKLLSSRRFASLEDEKRLQAEIMQALQDAGIPAVREYSRDQVNIFDFYIDGIVIEVKIKGAKRAIYKQCERYSLLDYCRDIILVTNVSMGFPSEINEKPCYVINLGKAWL